MKRFTSIQVAVMGLLASLAGQSVRAGVTHDVAFTYRMGAGFPGDITRAHPMSVVAGLNNSSVQAVRAYGDAVLVNTADSTIRGVVAGDGSVTAAKIYGVCVRPYPIQQQAQTNYNTAIGAAAVPAGAVVDTLRQGFIMVKLPAGAAVTKDGTVYVWCAASASTNVQGQFVAAANGTNTLTVTNAKFTGPADANGNAEIEVWAA